MSKKSGRTLRMVAIVFMGLTAAMNLLGGIGTVCAAFLTKDYPPMWALIEYQWLYQTLMITTIMTGIAGAWATVRLVKGGQTAYRDALIILGVGTILAGIQFGASLALRGKAMPTNMKFYANAVTLIIFLVLSAPSLREQVDFSRPGDRSDKAAAGGMAAFVSGIVMLSVFYWAGPSHTYMGDNWIEVLDLPLAIGGTLLAICGGVALIWAVVRLLFVPVELAETASRS